MLDRYKNLTDSYYRFWLNLANLPKKASIFPIDFDKSWFNVIRQRQGYGIITILCMCVIQYFYTVYPIYVGKIIESGNWNYFLLLMAVWCFIISLEYVSVYAAALMEIQCMNSVLYNSFKHFLTVDPIYHTLKSTGKLFSKITRCARSYENLLDIILWDLLPLTVSIVVVIGEFFRHDITLSFLSFGLVSTIIVVNIFLNLFTSATFEKRLIVADDELKSLGVESLTQVQLIRSSFATNQITHTVHKRASNLMYREGTAWLAFASSVFISRFIYILSVLALGWVVFNRVLAGSMTAIMASAIIITYVNGTYETIEIGRKLRKLLRAITRINDLYSFIQLFGKQTFPVLAEPAVQPLTSFKEGSIAVEAKDIYFDYTPEARIFSGHSMYLEVAEDQQNKLYGVIGPSGVGKTTLISLLGGQLKPDKGAIVVNGIPIYEVGDTARRSLIAMQGQVASSLSGTLMSNLLLGLPRDSYTNQQLVTVLKQVGLWKLFEEKQGLETPIGEGGMNLSGGQRQRLNFASLYLRAKYYRPVLILIDEPTSSLDEVSELAITSMISELSQKALTLVIAHRLNTLADAVGILDFSLLKKEQELTFYAKQELEKKSPYYKKLMIGDVSIED